MEKSLLKVGMAQIAPVLLSKDKTTDKIISYINDASKVKCDLVAFGEAILPGYPFWVDPTNGAHFNSPVQKEIFAFYVEQSIQPESGDLDTICNAAKKGNITVIVGTIEKAMNRGSHSLYCSLIYIDNCGVIQNVHRKLMPTYEERLVWSPGDGNGLRVFPINKFTVGALNCWENWMPLPRTSLYAQGEDFHVAIWPGSDRNTYDITKFIAKESRSYVMSVSGIIGKKDISKEIPHSDIMIEKCDEVMTNGGSCLAGPDGEWIVEPFINEEKLIVAEIDHNKVLQERQNFDPSGHYSRPDVTKLTINRERQSILTVEDK